MYHGLDMTAQAIFHVNQAFHNYNIGGYVRFHRLDLSPCI